MSDKHTLAASQHPFAFVQRLAAALSDGHLRLPTFPEIALRIQRALADPNTTIERLGGIVGSDPALAARIMSMANAAAFHTDRPVAELRSAILRLGGSGVRSAAVAFAMEQLKCAAELRPVATELGRLWKWSLEMAALCQVLAQRSRIDVDEAFLAGLMHSIGSIYILAKATEEGELSATRGWLDEVQQEWQANIGKAILQSWNFPEHMAEAIGNQDDLERRHYGEADLTDVLVGAKILTQLRDDAGRLATHPQMANCLRRLQVDPAQRAELHSQAHERLSTLRAVFS